MRAKLLACVWVCWAEMASAGGLQSLDWFLKTVRSGEAEFEQVVTLPAKPGQAARRKLSGGTFAFARPGRFRFAYEQPFVQTLVADGRTLWFFDAELNQVTARPQAAALQATPVALVAGARDVAALQADFVLRDAPDQDGLQWVLATPKSKDSALQQVRLGFAAPPAPPLLQVLALTDSLGQESVLRLRNMRVNPSLPASLFEFSPPPGAELIRP
ncbi:MAG: outer membrane lipoprotein chaperone LolA [Rhodoferax sp.]